MEFLLDLGSEFGFVLCIGVFGFVLDCWISTFGLIVGYV